MLALCIGHQGTQGAQQITQAAVSDGEAYVLVTLVTAWRAIPIARLPAGI